MGGGCDCGCCCGDVEARRLRRLLLPILRVEDTRVEVFEETVDEDETRRPTNSFDVSVTTTGLVVLRYTGLSLLSCSCGVDSRPAEGGVISRAYCSRDDAGEGCDAGGVYSPYPFTTAPPCPCDCCNLISPFNPLTSSVPLDGMALNIDTSRLSSSA